MSERQSWQKTIAVDFDGVIHAYGKGWHDGTIYDVPVAGVKQGLARLQRAGFWVMIYTTRASDRTIDGVQEKGQLPELKAWLAKHSIPYDEIYTGEKPIYVALIDDRAVRFEPNPSRLASLFGLLSPWSICEHTLEKLGIIKPGQGEEP